jgi:hypothetical protein
MRRLFHVMIIKIVFPNIIGPSYSTVPGRLEIVVLFLFLGDSIAEVQKASRATLVLHT